MFLTTIVRKEIQYLSAEKYPRPVTKDETGHSSKFGHHDERLGKAPVSYGRHRGSSENTSHM